jgi:hypothetical protein
MMYVTPLKSPYYSVYLNNIIISEYGSLMLLVVNDMLGLGY